MCLLMQINADTPAFSDAFIKSVFNRNSDGLGIMWYEDGSVHYYKCLPNTLAEAIDIFRKYTEGRECCAHWRMKTHGDIDLTNCHPYPVFGFAGGVEEAHDMPLLMMHNGVLNTGNAKDMSKSDTWHYVRDFIAPIVANDIAILHTEAFQKMLAAHIGANNKFAFVDGTGRTTIINRQSGVTYNNAWLSNTYAWDYYGLHPDAPKWNTRAGYRGYSSQDSLGFSNTPSKKWWDDFKGAQKPSPVSVKKPSAPKPQQASKKTEAQQASELTDEVEFVYPALQYKFLHVEMVQCIRKNGYDDVKDMVELASYGYIEQDDVLKAILSPTELPDVLAAGIQVEAECYIDTDNTDDMESGINAA